MVLISLPGQFYIAVESLLQRVDAYGAGNAHIALAALAKGDAGDGYHMGLPEDYVAGLAGYCTCVGCFSKYKEIAARIRMAVPESRYLLSITSPNPLLIQLITTGDKNCPTIAVAQYTNIAFVEALAGTAAFVFM